MIEGGPFSVILADPPWRFASNSKAKPGRNAMRHYPTMPTAEICALPVPAAKDAVLLLWATSPMLTQALEVMVAWGFRYKSQAVWVKSRIATGYWARNRHELLLIGTRGLIPCPKPTLFPDSVIEAPTREHSRKPDIVRERIEAAFPMHRKLEMFARSQREGWAAFGNEINKFNEPAVMA
jgi:N6-adenosine-specific RNA methylase IME4